MNIHKIEGPSDEKLQRAKEIAINILEGFSMKVRDTNQRIQYYCFYHSVLKAGDISFSEDLFSYAGFQSNKGFRIAFKLTFVSATNKFSYYIYKPEEMLRYLSKLSIDGSEITRESLDKGENNGLGHSVKRIGCR